MRECGRYGREEEEFLEAVQQDEVGVWSIGRYGRQEVEFVEAVL